MTTTDRADGCDPPLEQELPPDIEVALREFVEGVRDHSSLLDCLWGELYGSINIAEINDGAITKDETDPDSNVPDILKSALREIQTTKDFGLAAQNFTLNMCKNYYANPTLTSLATNAVSCLA